MALLSWFADRPVGAKLAAIFGVALVGMATLGAVGVLSIHAATERTDELNLINGMTRKTLEADMAHDAIRGDVQRALLATTAADLAGARGDLTEHAATIEAAVADFRAPEMFPDVRGAADEVAPAVAKYLTLAQQTLDAVRPGGRTPASYAEFLDSFTLVEERLPAVADALEARVAASTEHVHQQEDASIRNVVGAALGCALLLGLICWGVTRGILRPLSEVSAVLESLADGDLSRSTSVSSQDEVGRMARSADRAAAGLRETVAAVAGSAESVAAAAAHLTQAAQRIADSATAANTQVQVVAASAEQVSENVQTVAAGSEQMGASIQEIARNAGEASQIAADAVSLVSSANTTMSQLAGSSAEIGNVVKLISSIAEQTNLLALNATIEAARAGDAGKGFAVVAGEVKELAQETARATEDISRRVVAIQEDSTTAVDAIGRISAIIDRINSSQTTIASAVEEQTATTNEMNRNVSGAATGSTDIASNIAGVASATEATSQETAITSEAAGQLALMAERLTGLVGRFRY